VVPPSLNKLARLCRRLVSMLFVDPPLAECSPASDSDEDRESAELATRVLHQDSAESGVNVPQIARRAVDLACDAGSGFVRVWVDPHAGGMRPKKIQARPGAMTVQDAIIDPLTGAPHMGQFGTMYVAEDGMSLTEAESQATREWVPKLRREVLDGTKVRFIPHTAFDINEAEGVVIGAMKPLGEVRQLFPEAIAKLSEDDLLALVEWKPEQADDLRDGDHRAGQGDRGRAKRDESVTDDQMVALLTVYMFQSPQYPEGAYCCFGGNRFRLHKQPWSDPRSSDPLLVPLAQFKLLSEGDEDDPYGYGLSDILAGANEIRGSQIGTWLTFLDRFNRLKWLLPHASMIQPTDLTNPTASVLYFNGQAGKPEVQQMPTFPADAPKFLEFTSMEMDDEAGLSPAAQGFNSPEVKSGLHAQQLIEQTITGLAGIKQNTEDGLVRLWRVMLEQRKAFIPTEETLSVVGDEGQHKVRSFTSAELASTKDVRIQKGSMSMLSPSAKLAVAEHAFSLGVLSPMELKRVAQGGVSWVIGETDDPHLQRIRRQITDWLDGPPEGWMPQAVPAIDPATGMEQLDPMTGQPMMAPDPVLAGIWEPRVSDVIPEVALVRFDELARLISGTKYGQKPPEWRGAVDAEFARMQMAAAPPQPQEVDPETGEPIAPSDGSAEPGERKVTNPAKESAGVA
jgi:hypothetical protein